ncbi:hypothetical protein [Roseovarius tolerans]|uniref:hypothetical protein n=1 Tax=Roseovarius tolerans TaxID=74031 RepID=UPI0009452339|nr:hypothetical protein [Roseovarius tolerans]
MATFTDTDELRVYLRRLKTYEQFWDAKEPAFFDAEKKAFWDGLIAEGWPSDSALYALKTGEIWAFVVEQGERRIRRLH